MFTDASQKLPDPSVPNLELPEVLDIQIRRIPFKAPKLRNFESKLSKYTEAVEFLVRTGGPIPVRALGPALYIGDVPVIDETKVEDTLYRFLAFEIDALEPGAPISWGWMKDPKELWKSTGFRY